MICRNASLAIAVAFIVFSAASWAAPVTAPPGLNPGDEYRLAFVTSTPTTGWMGDISIYNGLAETSASAVPELATLGTTWKAIVSTAATPAINRPAVVAWDNTDTNPSASAGVPIYNLAGGQVAESNADLWDGAIDNTISYTEHGVATTYIETWTGVSLVYPQVQSDPLGTETPFTGWIANSTFWATSDNVPSFEPFRHEFPVYALSGVLTAVPEPSTVDLATFGCLAVVGLACRRRQRG